MHSRPRISRTTIGLASQVYGLDDVALFEAKRRLSELVNCVEAGEEIAITRVGKAFGSPGKCTQRNFWNGAFFDE